MTPLAPAWLKDADIIRLFAAFGAAGKELRFVGGCVRDLVLGREVSDMDAATNALPEVTIELLQEAGIRVVPTGLMHGTVTAFLHRHKVEITTLRRDSSTDGRHAEVEFTEDWREDASRRDFTMNALYMNRVGELFDYYGGVADAKAGLVRFIGDAEARIQEDYLRILRFFRFYAQLGSDQPDAVALAACKAHKAGIDRLSGERIQQEMIKLLGAPRATISLAFMEEVGILPHIALPQIHLDMLQKCEQLAPKESLLKLACLLGDATGVSALAERWRLSKQQQRSLMHWLEVYSKLAPDIPLSRQKQLRRAWGADDYASAVMLAYAHSNIPWHDFVPLLSVCEWEPPLFPVTGADLQAKGMEEGKGLGEVLRQLELAWEQSDYKLDREELLRLV